MLLDVLDVKRATETIIGIDNIRGGFLADNPAEQVTQLHRVVNAEIQAQAAERVVDVRGVKRKTLPLRNDAATR